MTTLPVLGKYILQVGVAGRFSVFNLISLICPMVVVGLREW